MIFLLGGEGFIGSAFARILHASGVPFEIITRENYASFTGKACDLLINANGNSKKFVARDDPRRDFSESVVSVRNSMEDFRFAAYVFLSTSDIYPDCSGPDLTREEAHIEIAQQGPYGFHKYLAEQCVRYSAKRWLIVRQGGFVGPGIKKNVVYDILYGNKLWVGADSRFQFIHTDDSARAILSLIGMGIYNEIVNITGRGTISVAEIMRLAGRKIAFTEGAAPVAYEISTAKAERWLDLPRTRETVEQFVRKAD